MDAITLHTREYHRAEKKPWTNWGTVVTLWSIALYISMEIHLSKDVKNKSQHLHQSLAHASGCHVTPLLPVDQTAEEVFG